MTADTTAQPAAPALHDLFERAHHTVAAALARALHDQDARIADRIVSTLLRDGLLDTPAPGRRLAYPNLDEIRCRIFDVRWLGTIGTLPDDAVRVAGQERRTVAALIADDLPALVNQVETLRARLFEEEKRAEIAEQERDNLLAASTRKASTP